MYWVLTVQYEMTALWACLCDLTAFYSPDRRSWALASLSDVGNGSISIDSPITLGRLRFLMSLARGSLLIHAKTPADIDLSASQMTLPHGSCFYQSSQVCTHVSFSVFYFVVKPYKNGFRITLKTLEDNLLSRLSWASGNFLGDIDLLENLKMTKRTAAKIEDEVCFWVCVSATVTSDTKTHYEIIVSIESATVYSLITKKVVCLYK